MVVEFRRRPLLPLDDLLGHLRETLPQLTQNYLRCPWYTMTLGKIHIGVHSLAQCE